ncbi:GntR family transcriptional regulator [Catenulispora rubra]|uniref:GntR family transcriptional regulator n=1 Tax=Catenulispora rubra TaxID=280293 RepID=UPI00189206AC|nr:GntR family transcriptional regulator [Catenulispora rubra]
MADAGDRPDAVEPATKTHTVYDTLRRMILAGELAPDSVVSVLDLSRRFGVSRTPLRESLRLLERDGLIVYVGSHQHRSVRISPLSMSDLDELYALRVPLEALALSLTAPALRRSDLRTLRGEAELTARGDAEAHRRFHTMLRKGAGERINHRLDELFDQASRYQWAFMEREPDPEVVAERLAEHHGLVDALAAGDLQRARELLVDHLAGTALALMTAERHAPFALPRAIAMAKARQDTVAGTSAAH